MLSAGYDDGSGDELLPELGNSQLDCRTLDSDSGYDLPQEEFLPESFSDLHSTDDLGYDCEELDSDGGYNVPQGEFIDDEVVSDLEVPEVRMVQSGHIPFPDDEEKSENSEEHSRLDYGNTEILTDSKIEGGDGYRSSSFGDLRVPSVIISSGSSVDVINFVEGEAKLEEPEKGPTRQNLHKPKKNNKTGRVTSIIDMLPVQNAPQVGAVSEAWNEEFQRALSMREGPQKWEQLARTARDFVYCSKTYGKIIISEYFLPDDAKTIRPLAEAGHGVAGGRKYIIAGIFFKFALDVYRPNSNYYMYGDTEPNDEGAMKAARNDMIGLLSYYNSGVSGLNYPLMSTIDYRGFRLIALSIIPIKGNETLKYGSPDGAESLKYQPEVAKRMKQVGKTLNLKGHRVKSHPHTIYGPGDIEAHIGSDGKVYVLDFARTFPPEAPSCVTREVFYNLLRPEFVRSNPVPLSSDAYTGFESTDRDEKQANQIEVRNATFYLIRTLVPQFIRQQLRKVTPDNFRTFRLTEQLHRSGLNCRHLGRVRSKMTEPEFGHVENFAFLQKYLLSEMLARLLTTIIRNLLREEMRNAAIAAREEPFVELVFSFLQIVLEQPIPDICSGPSLHEKPVNTQNEKKSLPKTTNYLRDRFYWCWDMKFLIQQKFKKALHAQELAENSDIRNRVDMTFVLTRLCQQAGIKINKHAVREYQESPHNFKMMKFDIQKVTARVRHLNVIDEALANLLFEEAKNRDVIRPGLWSAINEKFSRAVASNTTNPQAYIHWGDMLMTQCEMLPYLKEQYSEKALTLLRSAYEKFTDAESLQNMWEVPFAKAQIQVIRGVVLHLFATSDAIALREWYFHDASSEFQRAFKMKPYCFQLIVGTSHDLFLHSQRISVTHSEEKQTEKSFLLLKAYYLLSTCLEVAPVLPDATIFHRAGVILYEYHRNLSYSSNNQLSQSIRGSGFRMRQSMSTGIGSSLQNIGERSLSHANSTDMVFSTQGESSLFAQAGSMFESAFLLTGSASDSDFTYTFPDCRYRPLNPHNAYTPVTIDVFHKEDYALKESSIDIVPNFALLYFVPFIVRSPEGNYQLTQSTNHLYNLLSRGDIHRQKHWEIRENSFILSHPSYHPVVVSQFSVCCTLSSPIRIHLIGTSYAHIDMNIETIELLSTRKAPPSSPGPRSKSNDDDNISSELNDAFLMGSFDVDDNLPHNFPITCSSACRYVTVMIESIAPVNVYKFHGFNLYGFQVLTEEENKAKSADFRHSNESIPQRSINRDVYWFKDRECSQKMVIMGNTVSIKSNMTKSLRGLVGDRLMSQCSVRATPSFSPQYEYPVTRATATRARTLTTGDRKSENSTPKRKNKRVSPVLYYISEDKSSADEGIIASACDAYKANKKQKGELTLFTPHSIDALEETLEAVDSTILQRRIRKGLLRIVINLPRNSDSLQTGETHAKRVVNLIKRNPMWHNILILVYYPDGFISTLRAEENFVWAATTSRQVLDFMAMRWSTPGMNFDPFGTFQRCRELPERRSKRTVLASIAEPITRRMRSSSITGSDCNVNVKDTQSPGNDEKLPVSPFVYFEIFVPETWEGNCEFAVGVTPIQFDINTLPGYCLGSYAWYGLEGVLYCGQGDKFCFFDGGEKQHFLPGDIVGCGYDIFSQQLYWSKNGVYIGSAQGGASAVNKKHASYLFATVGVECYTTIDIKGNFGNEKFQFDWRNIEFDSFLGATVSAEASDEEISLRSSQSIMKVNPYPNRLFESCESMERQDLINITEISKYSFALQCLLRAHLHNRTVIQTKRERRKYNELTLNCCEDLHENNLAHIFQLFPCVSNLNIANDLKLQNTFLSRLPSSVSHIRLLNLEGIKSLDISTARSLVDRCPKLEAIRVWEHITNDSLFVLSALSRLTNIEFVRCNNLTDSGIAGILRGRKTLEALQFDRCDNITEATLDIIRKSNFCGTLKKLRIDNCTCLVNETKIARVLKKCINLVAFSCAGDATYMSPVSTKIVETLCSVSGTKLKALNIYRCENINADSFLKLCKFCPNIEELNIGHLRVPDSALAVFARSGHSLQRLELVSTSISNTTLLLFATNHKNLRQLSVQRCNQITVPGMREIIPFLSNLSFLSMKETGMNDELIDLIAKEDIMPALKRLDIRRTTKNCSPFALAGLKTAKPNLIVYEKSNALIAASDGKNISTLKFPPEKINSVRLRKNSL